MNDTILQQRNKIMKVKEMRENERQTTKNQFHKSLSRIRESFNRGKDMLNDDMEELELVIKEVKRCKRNENIQYDIDNLKATDYDSDMGEFDKCLFDQSGRLNINQIKSALGKDYNPNTNYAPIQSKNRTQLIKQYSSKSCKFLWNFTKFFINLNLTNYLALKVI
jgi:hypothetical protein